MNGLNIYTAIGKISEELLAETEMPLKRSKVGYNIVLTAAACLVLCVTAAHFIHTDISIEEPEINTITTMVTPIIQPTEPAVTEPYDETNVTSSSENTKDNEITEFSTETTVLPTETTAEITETTVDTEEIAIVPKWEDLSESDKYPYLKYNDIEYSIIKIYFQKEELEFLCNNEIYGIDEYANELKSKSTAFYKVKDISEEYYIVIPTADGKYTAYVNYNYKGSNLGSFLSGVNFLERNSLDKLTTGDIYDSLNYIEYTLPDLQQIVENVLLSDLSVIAEVNPPSVISEYCLYSKENIVMYVYENGYIRIFNNFFYIGEDATERFGEYVEVNAQAVEINYTNVIVDEDVLE